MNTGLTQLNTREHLREMGTIVWDVRGLDVDMRDSISVQDHDRPDDCLTYDL